MTLLHEKLPFVGTFVAPSAGERLLGAAVGQPRTVVADAELLLPIESGVVDDTLAVLTTAVEGPGVTVYVACVVAVWPGFMFPSEQGNEEHAPVATTNVRRAGVGSLSCTLDAIDGPLLTTEIE